MRTSTLLVLLTLFVLSGCSERQEENKASGMKCGSGKCGANMFDGNSALAKKKKNILSQMREDDPRKECVIAAKTTKTVYDCVRNPKSKKMTMKYGDSMEKTPKEPMMKCGAGKCGKP